MSDEPARARNDPMDHRTPPSFKGTLLASLFLVLVVIGFVMYIDSHRR